MTNRVIYRVKEIFINIELVNLVVLANEEPKIHNKNRRLEFIYRNTDAFFAPFSTFRRFNGEYKLSNLSQSSPDALMFLQKQPFISPGTTSLWQPSSEGKDEMNASGSLKKDTSSVNMIHSLARQFLWYFGLFCCFWHARYPRCLCHTAAFQEIIAGNYWKKLENI